MRIERSVLKDGQWTDHGTRLETEANLVLVFGATDVLKGSALADIRSRYPNACIAGCTTAGEIVGNAVIDNSVVVTGVHFDKTTVRSVDVDIERPEDSFAAAQNVASVLPTEGLVHVLLFADGLAVNGADMVAGVNSVLPASVAVTGGLSGDGARFAETYVCVNGVLARKKIVLLGFYGEHLRVGHGTMGGWDQFGPERRITRSEGNTLYELDGRSALALYKEYLGPHAAGLPATGLMFPLTVRDESSSDSVVRGILGIDEEKQSITFAGDIPQGAYAHLMRGNFERLIEGAAGAARACRDQSGAESQLAILISCVGRKVVLKNRIDEEVEGVIDVLGPQTPTTGFYSYGEISPLRADTRCRLHNQTMTITTMVET